MKTTVVNKGVLIAGLVLAVSLAMFAIKTRYASQTNNLLSTPTPTTSTAVEPSPGSNTNLRKRPAGTENWLQYVDEKNNVAFLYPQDWYTNSEKFSQKGDEVESQLGFSPQKLREDFAGTITLLNLSQSEALARTERLFSESFQEKVKFQSTSILEINGYRFNLYTPFDKKHDGKSFFLAEINSKRSVQLSFDMSNDTARSIVQTLLFDGTRFED